MIAEEEMVNTADPRGSLPRLARRTNCPQFDHDLWELVFTHSSYRNEFHPEEQTAERLVDLIQMIGKAALRTAIYEFCLDQKGMDPAETSRYSQSKEILLSSLLKEFELTSLPRFSKGQLKSDSNKALELEFVEKFLGLVAVSSSYANVRGLIWERLNLSSSPYPRYPNGDAKSWLLECSQELYSGKRPVYELLSAVGPEHRKEFRCRVILPDKRSAEASDLSLKSAEQRAAAKIIDELHLVKKGPVRSHNRESWYMVSGSLYRFGGQSSRRKRLKEPLTGVVGWTRRVLVSICD